MSRKKQQAIDMGLDLIARTDQSSGWLLVGLVALLPLLVRATTLNFVSPGIFAAGIDTGLQGDFFTYYKWIVLLTAAVILNGLLLFKILAAGYELAPSYLNAPMLFLVLCILLSALTADFQSIAWKGLYNQHEGTLTYLAYLSLCFVAANTVFKPWMGRWTGYALLLITFMNMAIALWALTGHDITDVQIIRDLVVPRSLQSSMHGSIRSLLAHPNYSSGLSAALFGFFFTRCLLDNDLKKRLVYGAATLAAFATVLASMSSSGFVTILLIAPFLAAAGWLNSQPRRAWVASGALVLLCMGIYAGMNAFNPAIGAESTGFVRSLWHSDSVLPHLDTSSRQSAGVAQVLAAPQPPAVQTAGASSQVQAPGDSNQLFALPQPGWAPGTGRLYIWRQVGDLIMERPVFGHGLDTLAYYFPQNDVNMIANMWEYGVIVTKPHNFYLAMAYGAGLPALLALLALFGLYCYHTGRRLMTSPRDDRLALPAGLFVFCLAFMVQWLFNDSVLGSAAIFWVLLGLSTSLDQQL